MAIGRITYLAKFFWHTVQILKRFEMVQLATVAIVLQFIGAFFVAVFKDIVNFFLIKSPKSVKGKIVVITGGSGGIGRSLALRFCEHGATVVLLDINKVSIYSNFIFHPK